jgi:hypothetical protein
MKPITRAQREALLKIYRRQPELNAPDPRAGNPGRSYLEFRRTAQHNALMDCVMVPYCNMWLGIETDGYTHS